MSDTIIHDALALRRRLSARLRPLAIAIGVLISLGLPTTYYVLQFNALRREAEMSAARLAASLAGARDIDAVVRDFSRSLGAVVLRVTDARAGGVPEVLVVTPLADRWWNRLAPVGAAPVRVAGTVVGRAEVRLPQGTLLAVTIGLFVMSTITGVGLAFLVHAVPVRVVGGMESRLAGLIAEQQTLIAAGRVLASSLDLRDVLGHFAEAAGSLPGIDVVHIWLRDAATGVQTLATQSGGLRSAVAPKPTLAPDEGFSGAVIATRRPLVIADAADDPRLLNRAWYDAEGLRSFLGVPLLVGDTVLGALSCISRERRAWSPGEITLAETLASLAAVAIRNATHFGEMTRRRRAAESLASVGRELSQALDFEVLAARIQDSVRDLLATRSSGLYRYDAATGTLVAFGLSGDVGPTRGPVVIPRGHGVAGLAVLERQPVATTNVLTDPRVTLDASARARIEGSGYRSLLSVPLLIKDVVVGALSVGDVEGRVFTDEDVQVLQTFADQATLALENARLYSEAMRREREAEELARVARVLSESLDLADVGARIVQSVLPLFEARSSGLYALEPDGSFRGVAWGGDARARYTPGQRFPASDGVIGWVVAQNTTVASPDVLDDARFDFPEPRRSQLAAGGNRAVLAVPLRAKGTLIGVLAVADLPGRAFDDTELGLLQTFADQAGLALENARLYQRAQQAYAELAEAQDRLVRGETLRAMGELASGVAHHLNNLLAVILGRIQLALTREPPPEIARHLTIAERAAQDGGEVIRRMRGFGGAPPEQDLDAVDLNGLAQDIIELTRPRWEDEAHVRGVTITTRLEPGVIPPVRGEIGPLREVLMNLVLNAVDAMPEGGRITLRTWADDARVHCSVADTGVGMSPEVRQRALEPFFTTKGLKSTGLGLSVNYGILQRFGGELTIDSVEGRGTTITFTLPAANRAVVPATTPVTAPPRRLRVLVIDDEPEVRALLTEMLDAEGHDAVVAASGVEGLDALAGDGTIDVVLSDLGMPGMTGWDVARAVKSRQPELPVVLITGWGEDPEGRPEDRRAADAIIAKPITPVSLRAALARAAAG